MEIGGLSILLPRTIAQRSRTVATCRPVATKRGFQWTCSWVNTHVAPSTTRLSGCYLHFPLETPRLRLVLRPACRCWPISICVSVAVAALRVHGEPIPKKLKISGTRISLCSTPWEGVKSRRICPRSEVRDLWSTIAVVGATGMKQDRPRRLRAEFIRSRAGVRPSWRAWQSGQQSPRRGLQFLLQGAQP